MSVRFGVQKTMYIHGTHGEFTVGVGERRVRAEFLLTKIRPGSEGSWENDLATQMVPWREVFNVEEMTFDELLQRDLDDSRVAHDLIPYLMGEKGAYAKFFPPILAVIVPKRTDRTGIESYYPEPKPPVGGKTEYGNLFDVVHLAIEGEPTPFGTIAFNRQRTGFVIVDGQHRAMAVLALHRQLNDSWAGSAHASYYAHLDPRAEQIQGIELPVCLVYFPELHEGDGSLADRGIDLRTVCREIFLVVNRSAKHVSRSRELLLDDEDWAALMMRRSLSKLKKRGEDEAGLARIYSIAYGDSDADTANTVLMGQLEYASAISLFKTHAAAAFGSPSSLQFESPADISDARSTRNKERPTQLLVGTALQKWQAVNRGSAKNYPAAEVEMAVHLLGDLADSVTLAMFDRFRPFEIHNAVLRRLRTRLNDPASRADPIQTKCATLLFEGSGVRNVFTEHVDRLKGAEAEASTVGEQVSDYIAHQLQDARAVLAAMERYEEQIRTDRAALLFGLDADTFFGESAEKDKKGALAARAKSVYDTISTQAFQLGFLMAVLTVVERSVRSTTPYDERMRRVRFVVDLFLGALNSYFGADDAAARRSERGLGFEDRGAVFDLRAFGLRGLLAESTKEINEREWRFFRYAILEIVHSEFARAGFASVLQGADADLSVEYLAGVQSLSRDLAGLRTFYVEAAVREALRDREFQRELDLIRVRAEGGGQTPDQIEELLKARRTQREAEVRERAGQHLVASLGEEPAPDLQAERVRSAVTGAE